MRAAQKYAGDSCAFASFRPCISKAEITALHSVIASPCPPGDRADRPESTLRYEIIFAHMHDATSGEQLLFEQQVPEFNGTELAASYEHSQFSHSEAIVPQC